MQTSLPAESAQARDRESQLAIAFAMVVIVTLSVALRLFMVLLFPTQPVSDFAVLTRFAQAIAEHGPVAQDTGWQYMNAGLPLLLGMLLKVTGGEPAKVARLATAMVMGLLPLLPLLMLRGVTTAVARLLMASLLAFLPMFWVFSGVIAQDNWICVPIVALACLALRNWTLGSGFPIWGASLWCLAILIRQEMLVVALPIALVAAWPHDKAARRASLVRFAVVSLVLLVGIASQRGLATGHYSVTTSHGSHAILGSYVPGARFSWAPPATYLASHDPQQGVDLARLQRDGIRLAMEEISQRPVFHVVRRAGALVYTATGADKSLQGWALRGDGVLPTELKPAAGRLSFVLDLTIPLGFVLLHGLFLGSLIVAWKRRDWAMACIIAAIAMKVGIHGLVSVQARFFLVAAALEVLVVGQTLHHILRDASLRRWFLVTAGAGIVLVFIAWRILPAWGNWVDEREWAGQAPHYRFPYDGAWGEVDCTMDSGRLANLAAKLMAIRLMPKHPSAGDIAELKCILVRTGDGPIRLEIEDRYAGTQPRYVLQEIAVTGVGVQSRDLGEKSGAGWWGVDLPPGESGARIGFSIKLTARQSAGETDWGHMSYTNIRLVAHAAKTPPAGNPAITTHPASHEPRGPASPSRKGQ